MSEDLLQQISGRFDVEEVVSKANNNPEIFKFYAQHLIENTTTSWRAAWVINHARKLITYVDNLFCFKKVFFKILRNIINIYILYAFQLFC